MGVIPNPKMAFIFPISYILALIFPILIKYFPKCVGKGSFPKSQIKSLSLLSWLKCVESRLLLILRLDASYLSFLRTNDFRCVFRYYYGVIANTAPLIKMVTNFSLNAVLFGMNKQYLYITEV